MGNLTNTFFDNLDAAATWSAGVAFQRSKALPLDKYSVFETKALAEEYAEKRGAYAETPVSYPGQVIAVSEGAKMVAYVLVEAASGDKLALQQIGIIPTGDEKTIAVTEEGEISLLVADTEVFKKDEEGNATTEKIINAGAQLVLQADGTLKWVQPDTSTAEGQAAALAALKDRVDVIEPGVTKPTDDRNEETNLWEAVTAAKAAAKNAQDTIDNFLTGEDTDNVINKLKEIQKALDDLTDATELADAIAGKADKVSGAMAGNFAALDENGNLTDSGKKAADFATPKNVEDAVAAEAEIARKAEKANKDAIDAIVKDATIKTFKGVEEEIAKYQLAGDYATKAEAQGYANAKDEAIAAAASKGQQGINDAAAAKQLAIAAQNSANTNALNITEIEKEINGYKEGEGEDAQLVPGLNQKVADHATRLGTLEGTVKNNTDNINDIINNKLPLKANQSDLNNTNDRVTSLETIVGHEAKTEGDTTTPATGLVKKVTDLESRMTAEEEKIDNNTTYSFKQVDATDGILQLLEITEYTNGVKGTTFTYDTNANSYVDSKLDLLEPELVEIRMALDEKASIEHFQGVDARLQSAEGEIDDLQETIKGLSGAMHFKGVVTSDPTAAEFDVTGYEIGDVVIYGSKEYVFAEVDVVNGEETTKVNKFVEFGDATGNASAITALDSRVKTLEDYDHAADHAATLKSAKDYADSLAGNYATAEQGGKADTAIQGVTSELKDDEGNPIATGLKVEVSEDKVVNITFDDTVVFRFNGGSATSEW